jgi:hypothetical protein
MVRPCNRLDDAFMALAVLVGARAHSCRYCYGALTATLRIAGIQDDLLLELDERLESVRLPEREREGLIFVRRASAVDPRHTRGPADLEEAGYTREQAGELTFLVAIEAITSRLATPLALPFSEVEQWRASWWGRLFRPVLARAIRSLQRKQPDRVLTAEELGRPFGGLLATLGASPAAGLLRQAIDDCLSSGLADLRTKVLAIGVVGRAAGCAYTEREARALWEGTGLDPKVFDEVMTHLASPSLSAFEHRVVRYARQSVAYEVSQFQGLARTLADGTAHGVLVDVVGTVALANGLVRLGILVET